MTGSMCGHNEAELRAAADQLARATEGVAEARRAVARAEAAEWSGPAAAAFRGSTAAMTARLGALGAALAGLALVVVTLQSEAAGCAGSPGAPGTGVATSPTGLVADGPAAPLLPLATPTPILRLGEAPAGPLFARGQGAAGSAAASTDACR